MHKIEELIRKNNSGEITAEEKLLLDEWYRFFDLNNKASSLAESSIQSHKEEVWMAVQNNQISSNLQATPALPALPKKFLFSKWWHYASAAAVIASIVTTAFFLLRPSAPRHIAQQITVKPTVAQISDDIFPGTSKAHLVLGNGSVISLDSAKNMELKEEDGTHIDKRSGKLVYKDDANANGKVLFNTLSTPRGGEYQLVLPDGSKVWLNAASSIKFPTRFEGAERTVYLRGEAYFEVAKNAAMPFQVKLDNDMTIKVLGTHFNVMSYGDESQLKTTLAEGIVKVTNNSASVQLSPSQQAVMKRGYQSLTVSPADVAKALAWKNGMIEFDGDDLPYIMRQLSRWYDVDVSFPNAIPKGTYKGAIRRQAPLSKVLEILKIAGVQFKMENKKLMVTGG